MTQPYHSWAYIRRNVNKCIRETAICSHLLKLSSQEPNCCDQQVYMCIHCIYAYTICVYTVYIHILYIYIYIYNMEYYSAIMKTEIMSLAEI
jgi:hypothetical protein